MTRAFTVIAAAILFASPSHAQNINPFAKFGGNWSGNGFIFLLNGTKEYIRCRGAFTPESAPNVISLKLELRCAGDSFLFILQGEMNYNAGVISGVWSEISRGINGTVSGTIKDEQVQAVIESPTFTATLELINLGDKQQIRITSPGGEMTDILVGLNRTGVRQTQQPAQ